MEKKTIESQYVTVKNRNNGYTSYVLPNGVSKTFNIGQELKINLEELKLLRDSGEGGRYLLQNYFVINDKDALEYLNLDIEPEYFYTEKEIEELLVSGSLDQLEDALNFAPEGVIDLIKDMGVKMQLSDMRKRDLIYKKTGFNITNAIMVNTVLNEPAEEEKAEAPKRKAAPVTVEDGVPARKAEPIKSEKYKKVTE